MCTLVFIESQRSGACRDSIRVDVREFVSGLMEAATRCLISTTLSPSVKEDSSAASGTIRIPTVNKAKVTMFADRSLTNDTCSPRAAHLLCDGEADDGVSLRDVPCHHSRVCLHRCDGHIDGRR